MIVVVFGVVVVMIHGIDIKRNIPKIVYIQLDISFNL